MAIRIKLKMLSLSLCAALTGSMILSSGVVAAQTVSVSQQDVVNVIINGELQEFSQPAVTVDGRTLVPLRGIFEALGAKVEWDNATRTATGTKDGVKVVVQIDNQTAYVNGQAVKLDVPAKTINGSTMVPLRFISESLGAMVEWDFKTRSAIITSQPNGMAPPAPDQESISQFGYALSGGIRVLYGRHFYGSKTQEEYDKVMGLIREKLKTVTDYKFGGSAEYEQYYWDFINGKRWDGDRNNRSIENRGLYVAESQIGALVRDGVSADIILKAYQAAFLSSDLLEGVKDPRDSSPRSAYDALFRGVSDCDSDAQVYSAVFDALGFNTAILGFPDHAQMVVEINGNWYSVVGSTFSKITELPPTLNKRAKYYWYTAPTYGKVDSSGQYTK